MIRYDERMYYYFVSYLDLINLLQSLFRIKKKKFKEDLDWIEKLNGANLN